VVAFSKAAWETSEGPYLHEGISHLDIYLCSDHGEKYIVASAAIVRINPEDLMRYVHQTTRKNADKSKCSP